MYSRITDKPVAKLKRKQRGVSLIEVLVATVIISIALLGMMQLQISSLKANQSAYTRSIASVFAQDILEKMRVNGGIANMTPYLEATGMDRGCIITNNTDPLPNCTPAQIADQDIFDWTQSLAVQTPALNGIVCRSDLVGDSLGSPDCDAATNTANPVVVYVWWNEGRGDAISQLSISSEI